LWEEREDNDNNGDRRGRFGLTNRRIGGKMQSELKRDRPTVEKQPFHGSLRELFVLMTTAAVLAAGAHAVGLPILAVALLAMLSLLATRYLWRRSPALFFLAVPLLVLLILWLLMPDVQ
jgi:hypothetical protein